MNDISSTIVEPATGVVGHKLAGRVALVTGGTRGIGAAICRSLASQGASVAAGYSGNTERAAQFVKEFSLISLIRHSTDVAEPRYRQSRKSSGQVGGLDPAHRFSATESKGG